MQVRNLQFRPDGLSGVPGDDFAIILAVLFQCVHTWARGPNYEHIYRVVPNCLLVLPRCPSVRNGRFRTCTKGKSHGIWMIMIFVIYNVFFFYIYIYIYIYISLSLYMYTQVGTRHFHGPTRIYIFIYIYVHTLFIHVYTYLYFYLCVCTHN